jgi:hypothetical protein
VFLGDRVALVLAKNRGNCQSLLSVLELIVLAAFLEVREAPSVNFVYFLVSGPMSGSCRLLLAERSFLALD